MKKFISMLCALVMVITLAVPCKVNAAEGPVWTQISGKEAWTYTDGQGTELKAVIQGNTLYIQGK